MGQGKWPVCHHAHVAGWPGTDPQPEPRPGGGGKARIWIWVVAAIWAIALIMVLVFLSDRDNGRLPSSPPRPSCPDGMSEALQLTRRDSVPADAEMRLLLRSMLPETLNDVAYDDELVKKTAKEDSQNRYDPLMWEAAFTHLGHRGGISRGFLFEEGYVIVEVQRFPDHAAAEAFRAFADGFSCRYADQTYRMADVDGSSGLRIRYRSGRVQERVQFVRGPYRIAVSLNSDGPMPDRRMLADLALEVQAHVEAQPSSTG